MKLFKTLFTLMAMFVVASTAVADQLAITDLSKGAKLSKLTVGGKRTADKFKLTSISEELKGLDCVSTLRGNYQKPGKEFSFKVNVPVTIYLLVDARNKKFNAKGWEKTSLKSVWDANKRIYKDVVYKKDFPAGTITIMANPIHIIPTMAVIKAK